jgi:hypothetical protein
MTQLDSLPRVLFFARGYQAEFFTHLRSSAYEAVFVTMTSAEKRAVERSGAIVDACFEEDFAALPVSEVPESYLLTAWPADRFLGRFGHERRREILGKEISFWRRLLERHSPSAVLNELVAIEISEVLLIECRRAGVKYLAALNCVVDGYTYWLPDPITLSGKSLPLPPPDERARQLARDYVDSMMSKDYLPFYVRDLSGRREMKPLAVAAVRFVLWRLRRALAVFSGAFRYEMYDDEYGKRLEVFLKGWFVGYDRLEALPEGMEVVFYPLHQEPEATLNYMSVFNADQVATIENILKCLRPDQVLVVKEHPVDKGALLRSKFQRLKSRSSSLFFLPAEVHGRAVLAKTGRVVTLTSTVGWEACVIGVPTYVLGSIFYDHFDRVTRVTRWDELRDLLRAPAAHMDGDLEPVVDFVARMIAGSWRGNPFPHSGLYSEENIADVVAAIRAAVGP